MSNRKTEQSPPTASPAPMQRLGVIFALFDPDGKMCECSQNLDAVTTHFPTGVRPPSFTTKMWNELFVARNKTARKKIYEANGWRVEKGTFAPKV